MKICGSQFVNINVSPSSQWGELHLTFGNHQLFASFDNHNLMMIMTMSVIWFAVFTYCDAIHFGENQVMVNVYPSLNNLASIQWVNQ